MNFKFATCILMVGLAVQLSQKSLAQDRTWTNASGGSFSDAANWDTSVPIATENAIFDLNSIFGIALTANADINSFNQNDGELTFAGAKCISMPMSDWATVRQVLILAVMFFWNRVRLR